MMNSEEYLPRWLERCSACNDRVVGYPLTNQAIREHNGRFYCVHHLTRYSRNESLQGGEYINGHWFFFDNATANNAIDWILAQGWDETANEDRVTLFQIRLVSDFWDAIPDDDSRRWEIFNPDKFFREDSLIKDQLQTKILRKEFKPLWKPGPFRRMS